MKPNHPSDVSDEQLDALLSELSFTPEQSGEPVSHQAPMGSAARILAALPSAAQTNEQAPNPDSLTSNISLLDTLIGWIASPARAIAASVLPLLLGLAIGGADEQTASAFASAESYPDDDQIFVLAGLTDEFTNELSMGFVSAQSTDFTAPFNTPGDAPSGEIQQ